MSVDYSQLELRLIAHFSQDPLLLAALNVGVGTAQAQGGGHSEKRATGERGGKRHAGEGERELPGFADHKAGDVFHRMAASWLRIPLHKVVCLGLGLIGAGREGREGRKEGRSKGEREGLESRV